MKTLFNTDGTYNEIGSNLLDLAAKEIQPLFHKLISEGYSIRDIAHVIQSAVSDVETCAVLDNRRNSTSRETSK